MRANAGLFYCVPSHPDAYIAIAYQGRWGDYSAAVSDESGNIWMATEAINPSLISLPQGELAANFGTFIAAVTP